MKYWTLALASGLMLLSCECSTKKSAAPAETLEERSERRVEARRDFLAKERASIETYITERELKMERTGTGLYYSLLESGSDSIKIVTMDIVEMEIKTFSLTGELLYSSDETEPQIFKVDQGDVEIGIHEAVKYLGLGDKGRFILPSHLAFGVAGDQNKVPPMTPLVYEIKILSIKKS